MKKVKLIPSVLILILCIGVLGVGIYAASPANNKISGTIKVNSASSEIAIWVYNSADTFTEDTLLLYEDSTRTGMTETIEDVLNFNVDGKNELSQVQDVTLTIKIENKSATTELGAYFFKGAVDATAPEQATMAQIRTNEVADSLQIRDTTAGIDFATQTFNKGTSAYKYLAKDDSNAQTTNNIQYLTVTFSLNALYDQELEGGFDIVINVEKYQPNYTGTGVYDGTDELIKISSTTGGATGTSANGEFAPAQNMSVQAVAGTATPRTSIVANAFRNNATLKQVVIPTSITSINANAFYHCNALEEVDIPASVTSIGNGAFGSCANLKEVNIGYWLADVSSIATEYSPNAIIKYAPDQTIDDENYSFANRTLTIKDHVETVTQFWPNALRPRITSVVIPNTATLDGSIAYGSGPFNGCYNIEDVIYSKTVENSYTFVNGTITFDDSVSTMDVAISGSGLEPLIINLIIPRTISEMQSGMGFNDMEIDGEILYFVDPGHQWDYVKNVIIEPNRTDTLEIYSGALNLGQSAKSIYIPNNVKWGFDGNSTHYGSGILVANNTSVKMYLESNVELNTGYTINGKDLWNVITEGGDAINIETDNPQLFMDYELNVNYEDYKDLINLA